MRSWSRACRARRSRCEVSALKRTGLDKLLEAIQPAGRAARSARPIPNRSAEGVVIEAKLERGRGPVGTVLVQRGTLRVGDIVVAGTRLGPRARADRRSRARTSPRPGPRCRSRSSASTRAPEAGDPVRRGRERGARPRDHRLPRAQAARDAGLGRHAAHARADDAAAQGQRAARSSRSLVKGDVQGSVEAIAGRSSKLGTDEVRGAHRAFGRRRHHRIRRGARRARPRP